ncbi:MAG: hypothetical protein WB729_16605 [Candidatus Sulfotelmatobacter sp.]
MGDEGSLPEMKDLTSTSFGYLIAFLLPGIFGLYALSYWLPQVGVILQPVLKADATVGPSVVFLIVAVGMGLCVSALRHWMFERLLCKKHELPHNLFALLYAEGRLATFKSVVDEHYRYHQFYGGCAVAVLVMFGGWLWHQVIYSLFTHKLVFSWQLCGIVMGFALSELLLVGSGVQSFVTYVKRGTVVVTAHTGIDQDQKEP